MVGQVLHKQEDARQKYSKESEAVQQDQIEAEERKKIMLVYKKCKAT